MLIEKKYKKNIYRGTMGSTFSTIQLTDTDIIDITKETGCKYTSPTGKIISQVHNEKIRAM